jgi:integrase
LKQIIGDVRVYSRHSGICPRKDDASYLKCTCPKWMQYVLDGKTRRESANTRSFAGVKLAAEDKTKQLRGETPVVAPESGKTVEMAVAEWLKFRSASGLNNDRTKYLGGKLVDWCKMNQLAILKQLTSEKVMQFRDSLPYKTNTSSSLKIHWSIMCGFFSWATGVKLFAENPVPDTRTHPQFKIRFKKAEVAVPSVADVKKALAVIDQTAWDAVTKHRLRLFMLTERWTGMAIMDTALLRRDRLDDDNRIRNNRRKTNERFKVRIPAWLAEQLRALPCSNPDFFFWNSPNTNPYSIRHHYEVKLRHVFKLAGVKMTSHGFRHFFITQQLAKGWSVDDVSTMVGTSPQEIRKTYHHWIKEDDDRMDAKWLEQGLDDDDNQDAAPRKSVGRVTPGRQRKAQAK